MNSTAIRTRSGGAAGLRSGGQLGLATSASAAGSKPFVVGRFSVFDEWAEVASLEEGRFMERIARGAFAATIREDRAQLKVIYDHGQDPLLGRRPIASLDGLGEDEKGGWYFGRLFDTVGGRELAPLLEAGQLGSSFRFQTVRDQVDLRPVRSQHNPLGLPQRTVLAARLIELGPTPFGVYRNATAGVSTGGDPPRSARPAMSRDEFLRKLAEPFDADTPARRAARERWRRKVFGPVAA